MHLRQFTLANLELAIDRILVSSIYNKSTNWPFVNILDLKLFDKKPQDIPVNSFCKKKKKKKK